MKLSHTSRTLVLALAALLSCAPALAEKPEWTGGGKDKHEKKHKDKGDKHDKHDKQEKHAGKKQGAHRDDVKVGGYFNDDHRQHARRYYTQQYSTGHCPPGLAKKNNGCMPPGQAKKYSMGQPLPTGVVYYPVPQPVIVQLPPVAPGYRYVRVGNDILLLSPQSSLVVDIIANILG